MGEVNIQAGVVTDSVSTMRIVFGLFRPRGLPEVGPVRLEYASAWTYLSLSTERIRVVGDVEAGIRYLRLRTLSRRHRTCC